MTSSRYEDGHFQLMVPHPPVDVGTYVCHIPSGTATCLKDPAESSITVDGTKARLLLLEVNQASLREENRQLLSSLAQHSQRIHDLENVLVPALTSRVDTLNQQVHGTHLFSLLNPFCSPNLNRQYPKTTTTTKQ